MIVRLSAGDAPNSSPKRRTIDYFQVAGGILDAKIDEEQVLDIPSRQIVAETDDGDLRPRLRSHLVQLAVSAERGKVRASRLSASGAPHHGQGCPERLKLAVGGHSFGLEIIAGSLPCAHTTRHRRRALRMSSSTSITFNDGEHQARMCAILGEWRTWPSK